VDAALLEVSGWGDTTAWQLLAFETRPYDPDVRREILALQGTDPPNLLERLARLHFKLGEIYAESCHAVARLGGLAPTEVDLVGMHGQTVFHGTARGTEGVGGPPPPGAGDRPQPGAEAPCAAPIAGPPEPPVVATTPATLQLGEAAVLAERTGLPVVSNFRARDVAAGGTGAPLVPYVDYLLFRSDDEGRLCLNLGGIANITGLPRGGGVEQVIAFDTGPGNMVLDALVERFTDGRETFDRNGERSALGRPDPGLLDELMAHEFIARRPPKSAGREEFGAAFVARLIERAAAR
jgi:anhydro-N-acetylmuramic acid kinase